MVFPCHLNSFRQHWDSMIKVRTGILSDAHFIVQSQIEMALESEGLQLDPPTVQKGVDAVFGMPTHGTYYLAEDENQKLLGCLLTVPEWSDWRNGTVIWIHSVYVIPTARRRGVYRAMYEHLKQKVSQDTGLRGLRLYVERKNDRAQQTYQALGMTKEHYELYEWLK
jgi:GNAT superfamily N-acetyltransferase